jgi:hypothetical protein
MPAVRRTTISGQAHANDQPKRFICHLIRNKAFKEPKAQQPTYSRKTHTSLPAVATHRRAVVRNHLYVRHHVRVAARHVAVPASPVTTRLRKTGEWMKMPMAAMTGRTAGRQGRCRIIPYWLRVYMMFVRCISMTHPTVCVVMFFERKALAYPFVSSAFPFLVGGLAALFPFARWHSLLRILLFINGGAVASLSVFDMIQSLRSRHAKMWRSFTQNL